MTWSNFFIVLSVFLQNPTLYHIIFGHEPNQIFFTYWGLNVLSTGRTWFFGGPRIPLDTMFTAGLPQKFFKIIQEKQCVQLIRKTGQCSMKLFRNTRQKKIIQDKFQMFSFFVQMSFISSAKTLSKHKFFLM